MKLFKIAFQMDPLKNIDQKTDSTLMLMFEAHLQEVLNYFIINRKICILKIIRLKLLVIFLRLRKADQNIYLKVRLHNISI